MLLKYKNLVWGVSEKSDGNMKFNGDENDNLVAKNRKQFFTKFRVDYNKVVSADLQNRDNIKVADGGDAGEFIKNTDGLVTDEKNLFLTITVADCLPIYFFDSKKEVVGLVHIGWREAKKNIVSEMIKLMIKNFSSNPEDILIYIGPHIQKCHFEVRDDMINKFKEYKNAVIERDNKVFINLSEVVTMQLLEVGILSKNIEISQECTYCSENKYFSYRRDKLKNLEAMVAYIGLKG